MTTSLSKRRPRDEVRLDPLAIKCPLTGCPTVTATRATPRSRPVLNGNAAGAQDGFRCQFHARTDEERVDESMHALASANPEWVVRRKRQP